MCMCTFRRNDAKNFEDFSVFGSHSIETEGEKKMKKTENNRESRCSSRIFLTLSLGRSTEIFRSLLSLVVQLYFVAR